MNRKRLLRIAGLTVAAGVIIGASIILYFWNMPHRDVQGEDARFELTASSLVNVFLDDPSGSNQKYLDQVIIVVGEVVEIYEDQLSQKVVVLNAGPGIPRTSCTFTTDTNPAEGKLLIGGKARIKGIVRSGAEIDTDLELNIDALLEKCSLSL